MTLLIKRAVAKRVYCARPKTSGEEASSACTSYRQAEKASKEEIRRLGQPLMGQTKDIILYPVLAQAAGKPRAFKEEIRRLGQPLVGQTKDIIRKSLQCLRKLQASQEHSKQKSEG